jgi:hypothetical protein
MAGTADQDSARAAWTAAILGVVGGAYRLGLTTRYWGHEEEDWGNLVLIRGVLDSGFGYVETEHMPMYSWLAAAATAAVGDPRSGGLLVAVLFGAITVALTAWIGARWLSPAAGVVAGLLVAFQPESALYAASTLRESTYTALMLGAVALIGSGRSRLGGLALAAAFLARFNPAFSLLPALLWLAVRDRDDRRRWVGPALALAAVTLLWAAYYRSTAGTWAFWGAVVERNSGDAVADLFPRERVAAVLAALGGLGFRVLPAHVGPLVVALAPAGLLLRGRARRPDAARWLAAAALGTVALLFATAAVSTYEWTHNLYWKWLTPSVPFLALFAAHAIAQAPRSRGLLAAALLLATAPSYAAQTRSQVQQSAAWYGSQIELARWVERAWPPGVAMITDAIPAWYLQSTRSPLRVVSWQDPALPHDDPGAFGAFLAREGVVVVQWFDEDWVGAREAAPFLADGKAFAAGPRVLVPVAREDGYGFIAYMVSYDPPAPQPREPPPAAAGALVAP